MVKSLSALVTLFLLAASVVALPSFAPEVKAAEAAALTKGDRLDVQAAVSDCSKQIWPDFTASCLRNTDTGGKIIQARLVTSRR